MTKYNQAFNQQVVAFYSECHENLPKTLKHFSLPSPTVHRWIAQFNYSGNNCLVVLKTKRHYTPEFKHHVIQTLFNARLTLEQATLQFGISNSGVISQ